MVKKINKKAQIKMQQTAFMLVAVTIFFILVGLVFLSIRLYNVRNIATNLEEENAMLLVAKLANSPEFSCGNAFGTSRINCIDEDKVTSLINQNKYSDFWGVAKIEIRRISPETGVIKILEKNVNMLPGVSNFVALCKKEKGEFGIYDKCELAKLIVSTEDKR